MNFDVKHYTTRAFWDLYHDLPGTTQSAADRQFELLKRDRSHPSLNFKKVGRYMSVRVTLQFRALALPDGNDLVWFWIGAHDEYERLIQQ